MARILVVDDDPQVLKLFTEILNEDGHKVIATNSGKSALELLKIADAVDLMVLDLSMPKPDGFEVLKAARTKWPGLRILVISGYLGGPLLKASELLGAAASLDKLEAPALLLETVNKLLR